jgi:hypothetical protein
MKWGQVCFTSNIRFDESHALSFSFVTMFHRTYFTLNGVLDVCLFVPLSHKRLPASAHASAENGSTKMAMTMKKETAFLAVAAAIWAIESSMSRPGSLTNALCQDV